MGVVKVGMDLFSGIVWNCALKLESPPAPCESPLRCTAPPCYYLHTQLLSQDLHHPAQRACFFLVTVMAVELSIPIAAMPTTQHPLHAILPAPVDNQSPRARTRVLTPPPRATNALSTSYPTHAGRNDECCTNCREMTMPYLATDPLDRTGSQHVGVQWVVIKLLCNQAPAELRDQLYAGNPKR